MDPSKPTKREFLLKHPDDRTRVIAYGWEGPRGYYAVLFVNGKRAESRELAAASHREARDDLISWAIELGFFTVADIDEATGALATRRVAELPIKLRTLVDVVRSFGQ